MSLLCYGFCDFFTLRPSDLITTLTYFLMDNICPCLNYILLRYDVRDKKFNWYFNKKEKPNVSEQTNQENKEFVASAKF